MLTDLHSSPPIKIRKPKVRKRDLPWQLHPQPFLARCKRKFVNFVKFSFILIAFITVMLMSFADGVDVKQVLANVQAKQLIQDVSDFTQKFIPEKIDVPESAKSMSVEPEWDIHTIEKFTKTWNALDPLTVSQYKKTQWFKEFSLALSLQLAQSHQLAGTGNQSAKKKAMLISALAESVETTR